MAIMLLVGEMWVRRSGRSPEWWDSWVILLWVRGFTLRVMSPGSDCGRVACRALVSSVCLCSPLDADQCM